MAYPDPREEMLKNMPPSIKTEVLDFAEFLLKKKSVSGEKKLKKNWAGALSKFKNQFTSVKLQKKVLDWRS
jgi:hypothetical protein